MIMKIIRGLKNLTIRKNILTKIFFLFNKEKNLKKNLSKNYKNFY